MRILILNERDPQHPKAGGAEAHIWQVFRRIAARECDVTLVSSSFPGATPHATIDGVKVIRLGALPAYYPRAVAHSRRETRATRVEVVVECLNKIPFFAPAYSASPVLALAHHLFGEAAFLQSPWPIAATTWTLERAIPYLYRDERFVAISESTRDDLIARGIRAEHIEVQHCGTQFSGGDVAPQPCDARAPRLIYVGRLERYKNVDVVIRAVERLVNDIPEISLAIVGEGPDRKRLEQVARDCGVADRIEFTGFVSDTEKDRRLAQARVSVCPSAKEGWGLAMLEANAAGTPNVASDAPGLRDSVRHGETGFLVAVGDVAAFAYRIRALLEDDALAARISAAAIAWSRHFTWDRAADGMENTLRKLARSRA